MINNRTARRSHRRGRSARLAVGALVTGAVSAIGAGHIAAPSPLEPLSPRVALLASLTDLLNPANLLNTAISNFNDATQVLSNADASQFPNFAGTIGNQISSQGNMLSFLGSLQTAENAITANGSDIGQTIWLYLLNLGWVANSSHILSLAHVVDVGLGNNLPGLVGLANYGLFLGNLGSFGQAILSLPTNFASLQLPPLITTAAALPAASAEPAAALPGIPALTPQAGDPFLELVQKIDGFAFTQDADGLYYNNDIIGTIAMQINADLPSINPGLGNVVESIASQILAGDWASSEPVTTDFFKEFVTNVINPNAFIDGAPADPGNFIETLAYQLDNSLENSVYAIDLNDAALILWP